MVKLTRRRILLAGLATGIAATGAYKQQQIQIRQQRQSALEALAKAQQSQKGLRAVMQAAFEADTQKINQGLAIQASLKLTPPQLPYDRAISKRLIQCSKLGTQQYLTGKIDPTYKGAIQSLPAYTAQLDGFTQLAALKGLEDAQTSETIEVEVPAAANAQDPLEKNLDDAGTAIQKTVKEAVKIKQIVPVYFGFVLASKTSNFIIFRGTQRTTEWIGNIWFFQTNYEDPAYGKVHSGIARIYDGIAEQTRAIAQTLDASLPCYISGHSLGAALATLAAIDLAIKIPRLKNQIRLYTYAGPRIGDPQFAEMHSRLIPNHYRIINLADTIPLAPSTTLRNETYVHMGQTWSFVTYYGDVLPNHAVDTYRAAVDKEVETDRPRTYPA